MKSGDDDLLSESELSTGLVSIVVVPVFVAHWKEAAILRCLDLQTVALVKSHWGRKKAIGQLGWCLIIWLYLTQCDCNVESLARVLLLLQLQTITVQ